MYLTAPLQNVTHSEHPRRLLFIQTPDPHQYDNMTTASCHSSERNKIFSSLNVFISLDGKCPIIHCTAMLEVHCWSTQLSAPGFSFAQASVLGVWLPLQSKAKQDLGLVGWLVWLVGSRVTKSCVVGGAGGARLGLLSATCHAHLIRDFPSREPLLNIHILPR